MGEKLGHRLLEIWPDHDIETVIPVPDTSRTCALQLANVIGIKYREGFIKIVTSGGHLSCRVRLNDVDL